VAFAINLVALFARLRLVADTAYTNMFKSLELAPTSTFEMTRSGESRNVFLGALAALASFALFHLVTVFPLSWMTLYGDAPVTSILWMQVLGALIACVAMVVSGWMADKFGRRNTLGAMAALIALFSLAAPMLLNGGTAGQNTFILVGFALLGLSYGQSSGTVTANFSRKFRYVGAAYSADLAWLLGAAFAPLIALYLSSHFGPVAVGGYLLSGAACTLLALGLNRALETKRK
jgi:MFS family permease